MNTGSVLSARILEELNEISTAAKRVKMAWEKAIDKNNDLYFDSVALNLHSFYSGIEKIFKLIAKVEKILSDIIHRVSKFQRNFMRKPKASESEAVKC